MIHRDRHPALPDVPTLARDGDAGLSHPRLGRDVRAGRHAARGGEGARPARCEKALNKPEVRQRFTSSGTDIYWSGPQEFDAFVKSELVSWTAMIKEAGIEPE